MDESVELLKRAIDILDGIDATKDNGGEVRGAIDLLDRLHKLVLKNPDTNWYPAGSVRRINDARKALNESADDHSLIAGAQRILKAVLRDWTDFWGEEELEG